MDNKERASQKTRDEKIGIITRGWVRDRFGVDETPPIDQKPAPKTPEVVLFVATAIEADWT